jgi:uncharacterized damage-inducible protein DinB
MAEDQTTAGPDTRPETVVNLLALIARTRGALEAAVAQMSDDELTSTAGGWSAKDHLAHVAAWERRLLGEMQGDERAAHFGVDQATFNGSTDELNALIYERHRDDPAATVRAEFQASGEAIHAAFASLSDADLMRPVRPDDPAVDALIDLISWDTYKHYPEHVAAITGHA